MRHVETRCVLPHRARAIWAVLTAFDAYSNWNPLNIWAEGKAEPGARVKMRFINPGRPGSVIAQTVRLTDVRPEQRLEWVGRVPLLFTGRHYFQLREIPEGTVLNHGERLSGLLPALWSEARMEAQRSAYVRLNEALAERLDELAKR